MQNNENFLHGRLDPGVEATLQLIEGVEGPDTSTFSSSQEDSTPVSSHPEDAAFPGMFPLSVALRLFGILGL